MKSILLGAAATLAAISGIAAEAGQWKELHRYALGGAGGWDLLEVDAASRHAFVTRGEYLMVVDVDTGQSVADIPGLKHAHGVALVPSLKRGYVSSGGDDKVVAFDLETFQPLADIATGKNPDAMVYDEASRHVFVFNGRSNDATVIDPATNQAIATLPVPGKPELAVTDGHGNLFVNLEDKNAIARIDTRANKVLATWKLGTCEGPTGLAIDRAHARLFPVCDNKQMAVLDAGSGKLIATVAIGDGPDGAAFDAQTATVFSPNSDGTLTLVHEDDPAHFRLVATLATPERTRAIALDEKTHRAILPFAEFGAAPAPTQKDPHPHRPMKDGSFGLLVVGQP